MAAVERTIVTRGKNYGHHDEGILSAIAKPGMHIAMGSNGQFAPSAATSAELVKKRPKIVKEDSYQGKTVNDAYASGDPCFYYEPLPGDVCIVLAKTGENWAVGDDVVMEGGGSGLWIKAAGTESRYTAQVLESTGGALGAAALIKVKFY
jgi:hypothetical protein